MKRKCEFCGKLFDRTIFPDGSTERPSRYAKRRFCSRQCAIAFRSGKKVIETSAEITETPAEPYVERTPLEHLLHVMRDPSQPDARRDRAAIAAAPYCHVKPGELGKKQQAEQAAKEATQGKFAPMKPPSIH